MLEFKNEWLELTSMHKGKDYIVTLYADDCPYCRSTSLKFYEQLADLLVESPRVRVARSDLTASVFWGIWPYDFPHTRFYDHKNPNTFIYVYEPYTFEAYYKFLKEKSHLY